MESLVPDIPQPPDARSPSRDAAGGGAAGPAGSTGPAGSWHASGAPVGHGRSIREFLTDGSLAALCARLSELSGVAIELRDEAGGVVVSTADPLDHPWALVPPERSPAVATGSDRLPILVRGRAIGEVVVGPGAPLVTGDPLGTDGVAARRRLLAAASLVAKTAGELCGDVFELRRRVRELRVLSTLSGLMASSAATVEDTLRAALDAALEVFGLDAGSVVLFPEGAPEGPAPDALAGREDEADLRVIASANLSAAWLRDARPLSRGRAFDLAALAGEVVTVRDLLDDPRVVEPEKLRAENLRGYMTCAMVFRGRPIGLIRLFGRAPRVFGPEDQDLLRSIGEQAASAVQHARLLKLQEIERRMERQLELARDVQERMRPARLPEGRGLDLAAATMPSSQLSGDFYDIFNLGPRDLAHRPIGMVIADVVGKGVPAALLASAVRGVLRAVAHESTPPGVVLSRLNEAIFRDTRDHEFVTMWYGVYHPGRRLLAYGSAGHEPPFLVRSGEPGSLSVDSVLPLCGEGMVLGVDPGQGYETHEAELSPGDTLVGFTDGFPDARSFDDEKYGFRRLAGSVIERLNQPEPATAKALLDHAVWALRRFTGVRSQVDDETLVVARATAGVEG